MHIIIKRVVKGIFCVTSAIFAEFSPKQSNVRTMKESYKFRSLPDFH